MVIRMKKVHIVAIVGILLVGTAVLLLPALLTKAQAGSVKTGRPDLERQERWEERYRHAVQAWRVHGRYAEAETEFESMLAEQPGYAPVLHELAQVFRQQSRDAEEHDALDQIVNPRGNWGSSLGGDPAVLSRIMLLAESLGETVSFLSARDALLADPMSMGSRLPEVERRYTGSQAEITSSALTVAGARLAVRQEHESAIELLEEALLRDPNNAHAAFYLGYEYRRILRKEECIAHFQAARRMTDDAVILRETERLLTAMGAELSE